MSGGHSFNLIDWERIRLVVFDVDGTLYNLSRLRLLMGRDLLLHAARSLSLETADVVGGYRRIREQFGERETSDLEDALVEETALATKCSPPRIRTIVEEWIERRPLRYLARCRYPGIEELFAGLRRSGKIIGIFSDYPARAKLSALGLYADHIVCATDGSIGVLKPHPRGLSALIDAAGATARETVLIGDRADRDGLAARRIGAWPLVKSAKPLPGWQTFSKFDGAPFEVFLQPRRVAPPRVAASVQT
jgi:HAD superfamily hydrolase (TIGR01549 family)